MVYTRDWDEASPADHTKFKTQPQNVRNAKVDLAERLKSFFYGLIAGETTAGAKQITFIVQGTTPSTSADSIIGYAKDVSGVTEWFLIDENGADVQMTKNGVINAFPYLVHGTANNGQYLKIATGAPTLAELSLKRTPFFYVDSELGTGTSKSATIRVPFAGVIERVDIYVDTPPTGADLIVDVNKNGTSIWASTQANRVKIAAGDYSGSQTSFDTTAVSVGDIFTIDIDQIGSTVKGSDLTVVITIKEVL